MFTVDVKQQQNNNNVFKNEIFPFRLEFPPPPKRSDLFPYTETQIRLGSQANSELSILIYQQHIL